MPGVDIGISVNVGSEAASAAIYTAEIITINMPVSILIDQNSRYVDSVLIS